MAKQDDWVRITLRLPQELHQQLTEKAGASSLNAEIVSRLEESLASEVARNVDLRSGYLEMPDGVTAEDLSAAIEEANKVALPAALRKLGITFKPLKVNGK